MTTAALAEPATPARPSWRAATLDDLLASRSAGFDLVRLVLAELVLVSHTWALGGFGAEPRSPLVRSMTLGGFAVGGFFALSGLLVGRSALRRPGLAFARSRAVRILPAYWAALVVSAFGAGLVWWVHAGRGVRAFFTWRPDGPFGYVGRAALLPVEFSHGIADVFASTPYGRATNGGSWVNGSLWTLPYEVRCYVIVGLLGLLAHRLDARRVIAVAWAVTAAAAVGYHWRADLTRFVLEPVADAQLVQLAFVFLTGALVAVYADRIRLFGWVPLVALVVAPAVGWWSAFAGEHLAQGLLALILPPIAALAGRAAGVLRGADLSYGLYLYAWPVQQLLATYAWPRSAPWFVLASTVLTVPLAAVSWFALERPLLRRWRPR